MKQILISGKKREATGKKASKELRKEGMIPCNLYGEATADGKPVALSLQLQCQSCANWFILRTSIL